MNHTLKYALIGGGVVAAVVLISRRMAAAQVAASKPTGIVGAAAGAKQVYDSLKTVFAKPASSLDSDVGGIPYGPGVSDGTSAVSDATGVRQLKQLIPSSTRYYDPRLAGLA